MDAPVNVWDYEQLAEKALDANAHAYFAGGAGDEVTLRDNVAAFERRKLRPRVLVDVGDVTASTTVLGPGGRSAGLDRAAGAPADGARRRRARHCTRRSRRRDDHVPLLGLDDSSGGCRALRRPTRRAGSRSTSSLTARSRKTLIAEAVANDYSALVLTVDTPYLGRRERDIRIDFGVPEHLTPTGDLFGDGFDPSLSWRDLEWLAGYELPLVVKGILTAEDARLACEHGADAIVVSNHGGRQLDGVSATLDALEEVVGAVDGRAEVLLDGGVRRGTDVLKALALGARAVLIGRAMLWGLAVAGEEGVGDVLRAASRRDRAGARAARLRAHPPT